MKKDITELFVFVDDFYQAIEKYLKTQLLASSQTSRQPTRACSMTLSEMLTIVLLYQQSPCKNFKFFYQSYLQLYHDEFPTLVSYHRFVELKERVLPYLLLLLQWLCDQTSHTGIHYVDTTSLAVCHQKRISRHKVFQGFAALGKTTKGWFYGLKLHLVINEKGQPHRFNITPGNVDDRSPVPFLTQGLKGLLFGDKGYIKQPLFEELYARGLKLVTGLKKGMKPKLMAWREKVLLRKRSIIETVFHILKNSFEIEHTRHRSITNAFVHIFSADRGAEKVLVEDDFCSEKIYME